MLLEPERLSALARRHLRDQKAEKFLSIASVWEMAIKLSLGKLGLARPLDEVIQDEAIDNELPLLSISRAHVVAVAALPFHHRDPFDRLLICQAQCEGLAILSADATFDAYGVRRVW